MTSTNVKTRRTLYSQPNKWWTTGMSFSKNPIPTENQQLSNGQILIIPKRSLTEPIAWQYPITKPTLISFDKCSINIGNQTFTSEIIENFNSNTKSRYSKSLRNTTTLDIKEVNHDALQRAIEDAEKIKVRPLRGLISEHFIGKTGNKPAGKRLYQIY